MTAEAIVLLDVLRRKAADQTERRFLIDALDRLSTVWTPVLFEKHVVRHFLKLVMDSREGVNKKNAFCFFLFSSISGLFTGDSKAARDESQSELFALLRKWLERSLVVAPAKVGKRNDSQKKKIHTPFQAAALFQECLLSDRKSGAVLLDAIGKLDRPFV